MSHGKSPYELRADLLVLAFNILQAQHAASARRQNSTTEGPDTAPTTEEVITEADKLNNFISINRVKK